MTSRKTNGVLVAMILVVGLFVTTLQSKAATYSYTLDSVFGGSTPGGSSPWLTASFTDVASGQVQLTLQASSIGSGNYVDKWYFNFFTNASSLVFTRTNIGVGTVTSPSISKGNNISQPGNGGFFDFYFDFVNSTSGKLQAGESIVYLITGFSGLNASMFNYLSTGGTTSWYTAAQVNGIAGVQTCGTTSGIIGDNSPSTIPGPTPEPATMAILGSFIAFAIYLKRRQDSKAIKVTVTQIS